MALWRYVEREEFCFIYGLFWNNYFAFTKEKVITKFCVFRLPRWRKELLSRIFRLKVAIHRFNSNEFQLDNLSMVRTTFCSLFDFSYLKVIVLIFQRLFCLVDSSFGKQVRCGGTLQELK
jgi:hypothetical protein